MAANVIFLVLSALVCQNAATKQPNILLVVADDFGWHDIGYHGSEIMTPNLDRVAAEGVKLENYYVQPLCTPTRSQLMSGKYEIHTGLQHGHIESNVPNGLPLEDKTLATKLKNLGYSTHMVGKWHLGYYKKEYTPLYRGFDTFFGYYTGSENYYTHINCAGHCGIDLHDNTKNTDDYRGQYSTHIFADRAVDLVNEHGRNMTEKPFFLYLPFQSVHGPLQVPKEYEEPYRHLRKQKRRTYAGMVAAMDEAVGRVVSAFEQNDMWENTLMIFTTDNGARLDHGGDNWPLRGGKASLYEGGVHGVGFVTGHMLKNKGVLNHQLVHVSDWYPTLVSLAGGDTTDQLLDGYDVWDVISENAVSPRREILHALDPLYRKSGQPREDSPFDVRIRAAVRVGDFKLITGFPGYEKKYSHEKYHLEHAKNIMLFNIKDDPYEDVELSDERPDKVMELLEKLAQYNATAVPCRYPEPDYQSNPEKHDGFWEPWQ